MTKIDIISGFLGAGKTTLIKKLIAEAFEGEKLVLIENEFGEIGIDGGFLKDAGVQITEMNSGCICCSLVGDFGTALKQVLTDYTPDRVIIEPSGVGKLSDVIKAVKDVAEDVPVELNSFVAVVDAVKSKMYMKNFGEFFNNQIENASAIVLSRTQNMSEDKLQACVAELRKHNEKASIITTPWDDMNGVTIRKAMEGSHSLVDEMMSEEDICPECGHHHHDHEEHEHHHHYDHDGECCHGHHHDHEEHEHHHHDGECCCGHHHEGHEHHHHHDGECCCGHDHHADEVFTSWGKETPKKFDDEVMKDILEKLAHTEDYGMILRAKGIVQATDGTWTYFDLTPGEYELRKGAADYTGKLCVIGSNLKEEQLTELFGL